jgi:hypothetical protein
LLLSQITYAHAKNLALYAFAYKATLAALGSAFSERGPPVTVSSKRLIEMFGQAAKDPAARSTLSTPF